MPLNLASDFQTLIGVATVGVLFAYLSLRLRNTSALDAAPPIHWSAPYSRAWIWWHRLNDSDTLKVHETHLRFGPVIRLAPKELSVCDVDTGLKPIYGTRLPKADWYDLAISYDSRPSFGIRDEESHRRRRGMVARPYTNSYIKTDSDWQGQQARLVAELVETLEQATKDKSPLEFFDLAFAWTLASITTFMFRGHGTVNLLNDLSAAQKAQAEYTTERLNGLWLSGWSDVVRKMFGLMGYSMDIHFIARMTQAAERQSRDVSEDGPKGEGLTPFENIQRHMLQDALTADFATKRRNLYSEIQDHIVAGLDTSQITLTICVWLLTLESNRGWQSRLREEVQSHGGLDRIADLSSLPVLDAIAVETMRVYPVVAGRQPRITDKTVALGPSSQEVAVPAGITVHAQAWTLHRSSAFEQPDEWDPDRWLRCSPERKKDMQSWLWMFGSGSRKCIGEFLAVSSLKTALAAIYGRFETKAVEGTAFNLHKGIALYPLPQERGGVLRIHLRRAS